MHLELYITKPVGSLQGLNAMIDDALVFLRHFRPINPGDGIEISWRDMDEDEHCYSLTMDDNGGFSHDNGFCSYSQDEREHCAMEVVNLLGLVKRDSDLTA